MAQTSRKVRRERRLKRERTLAFRMAELALKQRDEARAVANVLMQAINEKENPKSDLTITKVSEPADIEPNVENNPAN